MTKSEMLKNQAEPIGVSDPIDAKDKSIMDNDIFEKEAQINLDKDRLTYICDYCGKVNSVDEPRCTRCGKRRPRNEYIKAITAVREAKRAKEYYEAEAAAREEEFYKAQDFIEKSKERILAEKEEAQKMTMVRLVEERVADEKQKMAVREEARVEQEREYAKKMAAREAVLQIIAAEKYADEIIHQTKKEASEIILNKEAESESLKKDFEKRVSSERDKAINIAAEKLVAERAGIEKFATEQIDLHKKEAERLANEKILAERDESEKMAARRAVLQIIAAEKAAEDELKLNREALSRAALKRIEEEREIAQKEASAKFLAERQGIERAAEERIRAEREAVKKLLEERKAIDRGGVYNTGGYGATAGLIEGSQTKQIAQPFVIVPYVNSNQPLLQYRPNQVYRFVPNTYTEQLQAQERAVKDLRVMQEGPTPTEQELDELISKKKTQKQLIEEEISMLSSADKNTDKYVISDKKGKLRTRLISMFTAILILGLGAVLWFLPLLSEGVYADGNTNMSIFNAFLFMAQDGINGIIGTNIAIIETNSFVSFIRDMDYMGGVVLPFGLFIAAICYAVLFIKSVIRLITGRARNKGTFIPILALVFVQFIAAGTYLLINQLRLDLISNIGISLYAVEGISIIILVLSLINKKNKAS